VKLTDAFSIPEHVVAREVGGETMLLDMASGTYFGLDPIGGRLWQALEEGGTLALACDRIEADYAVERTKLEGDVMALAASLLESKLLDAA